jgi:hypothetical protein
MVCIYTPVPAAALGSSPVVTPEVLGVCSSGMCFSEMTAWRRAAMSDTAHVWQSL